MTLIETPEVNHWFEQGASVIDVGAESSRPGSESVSTEEQIRRSFPVIEALLTQVKVPISIDMVKEFDEVVFKEEVGKVHGPITQFGYYLVEITERTE